MEWLLLGLVGAGGGVLLAWRRAVRRSERREQQEEIAAVRRLADEDVTVFGEQLQRLDAQVGDRPLDEPTRADYQRALDAYEAGQRDVPRLRHADEVSTVVDTLAAGRYALACVEARLAGRPVPELRVPCFFNPQHGPSVCDVVWTRPARGTRTVPACAQDAARVAAREQPQLRTVRIGSRTVPYWEAGAAILPYSRGYFPGAAAGAGPAAALGWMFDQGAGGSGAHSHGGAAGAHGIGGAESAGHGDVGGWAPGGFGDGGQ